MKKLCLMASLLIILFTSCSEDTIHTDLKENTARREKGSLTLTEVEELKAEMHEISISTEWIEWQAKIKEFANKINYKKLEITSRDDFAKWIESNLSSTNFATREEGVESFNNLLSRAKSVLEKNSGFFASLGAADLSQIQIILTPICPDFPIVSTSNSCINLCGIFAQYDTDQANALYMEHWSFVAGSTDMNPDALEIVSNMAGWELQANLIGIQMDYEDCVGDCAM